RLFRLSGPLHVDALRSAFQTIVNRHEILRTAFELDNGEVIARPAEESSFEIPVFDLSGDAVDDRGQRLAAIATEETQRRMDLHTGPLMRAALVKLDAGDH